MRFLQCWRLTAASPFALPAKSAKNCRLVSRISHESCTSNVSVSDVCSVSHDRTSALSHHAESRAKATRSVWLNPCCNMQTRLWKFTVDTTKTFCKSFSEILVAKEIWFCHWLIAGTWLCCIRTWNDRLESWMWCKTKRPTHAATSLSRHSESMFSRMTQVCAVDDTSALIIFINESQKKLLLRTCAQQQWMETVETKR